MTLLECVNYWNRKQAFDDPQPRRILTEEECQTLEEKIKSQRLSLFGHLGNVVGTTPHPLYGAIIKVKFDDHPEELTVAMNPAYYDLFPVELPKLHGQPGTPENPLKARGTIQEIAQRVKAGKWTTLDLDALADYVLEKTEC